MIKAIYEKIADKTLSFGCKIIEWWSEYIFLYKKELDSSKNKYNIYLNPITNLEYNKSFIDKIIWHPVMIWDVLDYIDSMEFKHSKDFMKWRKEQYPVIIDTFLIDWEHKRKPIEEQSSDCIEYIYNLIK